MSASNFSDPATRDQFVEVTAVIEGAHLRDLAPFTTLLVRTMNSLYRVVIIQGPEVYVQGGAFFPDTTTAYLGGVSIDGNSVTVGWIGVGLLLGIHAGDRRVITSPVRAITRVQASSAVVH